MKKIINIFTFIAISTFIFYGCGGGLTAVTNDTELYRVVEVENMSKDEIFIKSMEWFSRTFKESKSVIDYQDKEAGKIMGNGAITHYFGMIVYGQVKFSVKIEAKESRSRITLSNFSAKIIGSSGPAVDRVIMEGEYIKALPKLEILMDDYATYLKTASSSNDNW
jgi:hypothetical protein